MRPNSVPYFGKIGSTTRLGVPQLRTSRISHFRLVSSHCTHNLSSPIKLFVRYNTCSNLLLTATELSLVMGSDLVKKLVAVVSVVIALLSTSVAQASTIHTVLPGDTLWKVGIQQRVPYDVIRRTSGLTSNAINVGQFLWIPDRYVAKGGDTLWTISQRYGLSLSQVRYFNNEWDSQLYIGQVLYLPTPLQNVVTLSAADRDLFERLVSAEAKGESFTGQVAVANVVLNRVKSPDFPNTVRGVIMQYYGSVPAFSPVDNGEIYQPAVASAKEAVRTALLGYDYSLGAQFFYNPALTSADNWIRARTITTSIGNHLFAR